MVLVEYQQANFVYFTNAVNKIYWPDKTGGSTDYAFQNTGWHFIPNQRYDNWLTPKQWYDLVGNHSAFKIHSCEAIVQNMIPLTDNLSIQQDSTFMSFNNTIYALGYTDKNYETTPVESGTNLIYREGITVDQTTGALVEKQKLPLYRHPLYRSSPTVTYSTFCWDPFTQPANLMELRPGKNSITFGWKRTEEMPFTSTMKYYSTQNTHDESNLPTNQINKNDYRTEWITPPSKFKQDPRNTTYNNVTAQWYSHYYEKPINNWFIKMIPILDRKGNLLNHTAQVCIIRKITFEVLPRKNTTNFPQVPYTWADINLFSRINPGYSLTIGPLENTKIPPFESTIDTTAYYTPPADKGLEAIAEESDTE